MSARITLACAAFAVVTGLVGLLMYVIVHEEIEQHLDRRSYVEAQALLAAAGANGLDGVLKAVRAREAGHSAGDLGYIVLDAGGVRVGGTLDASPPPAGFTEFVHYRLADGSRGIAQAFNGAIPGGGRLVVATDRSAIDQMDRTIFAIFGLMAALIVVAGIAAILAVRRTMSRRLGALGATAEAIMAGDLTRRMPILEDTDFDQISQVINGMLDRIEALLSNLRQLSTDLAHDIRSPLNRVRGSLEAFDRSRGGDTMALAAIADIDDLLELLTGILGISEIEGFAVRERFVELDLDDLVADLVDGYQASAEAAGMTLAYAGCPARLVGDPALLRRSLANLLDNALLHARGATRIAVGIDRSGSDVVITVGDDGPGVPPEQHQAIFRRFVRLDASRSTPGHGLGLNMVRAILHAHRGEARVLPSAQGLVVELTIPAVAIPAKVVEASAATPA